MARLVARSLIAAGLCASLAASLGCAARLAQRNDARPNYVIPVAAVSKVTLVHCDPQTKPLKCDRIAVTYRNGAEQLQVKP